MQHIIGAHSSAIAGNKAESLLQCWIDRVKQGDAQLVQALYADSALLLPTISSIECAREQQREDYFNIFLQLQPQGVLTTLYQLFSYDDIIVTAGSYQFIMADATRVKARYSVLFKADKIILHHSSREPNQQHWDEHIADNQDVIDSYICNSDIYNSNNISHVDQAKQLLNMWLNAIASGQAQELAQLYAHNALILPIYQTQELCNHQARLAYCGDFLNLHPLVVIDSTYIQFADDNLCIIGGSYTLTLDNTRTIKARYDLTFMKSQAGEWKIVLDHCSSQPD
jgi:hypothetical protein